MDVIDNHESDDLAYTLRVLLNCFSSNSDAPADRICQDPEAVALLALACEHSKDDMFRSVVKK
jgi:hypothetical protein